MTPVRGVIISFGIIHVSYRIVVSRNIPQTDTSVTPLIKTVEVIGRSEIPAKRAGDHHTGVAVISSVPVRQLQADRPVKVYHIHPDLILFPGAVVAVRLKGPLLTFDLLQPFV